MSIPTNKIISGPKSKTRSFHSDKIYTFLYIFQVFYFFLSSFSAKVDSFPKAKNFPKQAELLLRKIYLQFFIHLLFYRLFNRLNEKKGL